MFFKKKRYAEASEVEAINQNLRVSFSKIRSDISAIKEVLSQLLETDVIRESQIKDLDKRLEELGEVVSYTQESNKVIENQNLASKEEERYVFPRVVSEDLPKEAEKILEILTSTQKAILFNIINLIKESGINLLSAKIIAQECYPDKEYSSIKSTISEYLDILAGLNIVKRVRKGKQLYISLTEKGSVIQDKTKQKIKIVNKKK